MQDFYIKAVSEAALIEALQAAGVVDAERNPQGVALDVVGTIHKQTGEDKDGKPILTAQPGYHANLRGDLTPEQQAALPIVPAPVTPYRVWA